MSKVRISDNTDTFINDQRAMVQAALRTTAEKVQQYAKPVTPRKTGDLRRMVSVEMQPNRAIITWEKEYAAAQDVGTTRGHQIRNYTTSGTGKGFSKHGVDKAAKDFPKLLSQALRSIR